MSFKILLLPSCHLFSIYVRKALLPLEITIITTPATVTIAATTASTVIITPQPHHYISLVL